jgi:hypothetical protein
LLDLEEVKPGYEIVGMGSHRERPRDMTAAASSAQVRRSHRELSTKLIGEHAEVEMVCSGAMRGKDRFAGVTPYADREFAACYRNGEGLVRHLGA